jgi:hypothetical protein
MRYLTFLLLFHLSFVSAETYELYKTEQLARKAQQIKDYKKIVEMLEPEDEIKFSNGKKFKIIRILDATSPGETSRIFEIEGGRVIRINNGYKYRFNAVTSILNGYEELSKSEINIVKTYPEDSLIGEYVIHDKVKVDTHLGRFLKEPASFDGKTKDKMRRALKNFLIDTYQFVWVGDMKAENIVWNGDRWIFIDWTENPTMPIRSEFGTQKALESKPRNTYGYKDLVGVNIFNEEELKEIEAKIESKRNIWYSQNDIYTRVSIKEKTSSDQLNNKKELKLRQCILNKLKGLLGH